MKALYLIIVGVLFGSQLNAEKPFTNILKLIFYDSQVYKDKALMEIVSAVFILLSLFGLTLLCAAMLRFFKYRKLVVLSSSNNLMAGK